MFPIHYRTVAIDGHQIFYRESGPADAPTVLLLHGYPTSSFMFRDLIPLLSDRYHIIAPDHLGFGLSDSPTVDEFDYSFAALSHITSGLLDQLHVDRFAVYVQDYGAPIAWRIALEHPAQITAIISQNGNAYEEGLIPSFWDPIWAYTKRPSAETAQPLLDAMGVDAITWQYTHGVPDPSVVSPDTWMHDAPTLERPGNHQVQLRLFADYHTNVDLYPALHQSLRATQTPLLAVWGANDQIFAPTGATAFQRDLPDAEIHLLDGGHFLLESQLDTTAAYIRAFLGRTLPQRS